MDSEFAIDEELRQLDELNEKYFRYEGLSNSGLAMGLTLKKEST